MQTKVHVHVHWIDVGNTLKKVMSNSVGQVDFAVGLVDSILPLPDGQVKILQGNFELKSKI